jgi:hypothetical protein
LKIDLVEIDRENQNARIEWEREHADEPYFDYMAGRTAPRSPEEIEARKNKPLLDTEADSADLLFKHIEKQERIEKLLTSAELRRDRILREIELRRDHIYSNRLAERSQISLLIQPVTLRATNRDRPDATWPAAVDEFNSPSAPCALIERQRN